MTVGVCVCICVGTHVRGSCLCDAMRNVCLPVGLSQGVPAMANAANEGAFARVCACTLKPSKCSRLRRAPSTWLKRHTSSAAIFLSPSLSHYFSFSSLSTASFLPHIGVNGFSPFLVFLATHTHTRTQILSVSLCSLSICTGGLVIIFWLDHACV